LLGGELAQIIPPKLRGVSSNTDKPAEYITALHKHLTANNAFTQTAEVINTVKHLEQVPTNMITTLNKIDRTIARGMLMAETR
jgi:hypothetical protein